MSDTAEASTDNREAAREKGRREALQRSLTNIRPSDRTVVQIEELRRFAKGFGDTIFAHCPSTRERSLAITHLEETVMWAVKSLVMAQPDEPTNKQEEDQ